MAKRAEIKKLDWIDMEVVLQILISAELRRVPGRFAGERFYGFAVDCNSDYGGVILSLNTEERLRKAAEESAARPPIDNSEYWAQLSKQLGREISPPPPKPRESVEHYLKELRWSTGGWDLMEFQSAVFNEAWEPFADAVNAECTYTEGHPNEVNERFMKMVCRVVLRLEKEGAFAGWFRTEDFRVWVADHDEADETSEERLRAVRAEMGG